MAIPGKKDIKFLRTTIIGGVLFLVPVMFLGYIAYQAVEIMLIVARPLAGWLPVDTVGGVALANLIAIAAVILVCFIAGLLARNALAGKAVKHLENKVLVNIPGYGMIRGLKSSFDETEANKMKPLLARIGGGERLGLEMQRLADGRSVVFIPSAPSAWSGITMVLAAEYITYLDVPATRIVDLTEKYGHGMAELFDQAGEIAR